MKPIPQISDAEYKVMKVVWNQTPVSTPEVTDQLTGSNGWSPKTVQTMLSRLVKKGALTYEKRGRAFYYIPLVDETEVLREETTSFLDRFYNGCISSMVSNFLEEDRLTAEEIDDLRKLLDTGLGREDR